MPFLRLRGRLRDWLSRRRSSAPAARTPSGPAVTEPLPPVAGAPLEPSPPADAAPLPSPVAGATPAAAALSPSDPNAQRITALVVHHTVTPRTWTVADIRRLHVQQNGWDDVGYHYLVYQPTDASEATVLPGRAEDGDPWIEGSEHGAHEPLVNASSLAIALIWNAETDPVPPAMYTALVEWLTERCRWLGLDETAIRGHREYRATACPGQHLNLDHLRADVGARLAAT